MTGAINQFAEKIVKRNRASSKGGFTFIEIVIIILIIAILGAVVVPKVVDLTQRAQESSEAYTVGAINTGLALQELGEAAGVE